MKGVRGLLTIAACLLLATPAVAGTLYRCDGADGARSYVSKRVAGAKCVVVARSSPASTPRSAPASIDANAPATFGGGSSSKSKEKPAVVPSATPARKPTRLVQGPVYSYITDGVRPYTSKRPQGVAAPPAHRPLPSPLPPTC